MSAFLINRNNEITEFLPELKRMYKTSNNTTAVYSAIEDLLNFKMPEFERLKDVERKYKELKATLKNRETVDNMLKKFILEETVNEIEQ